jgi:hypothetical protein
MEHQSQHKRKPISIDDFPDQPLVFHGEIIAITKIKGNEFRLKISLSDGTYFETNCGNDEIIFGRLCKMFDIGKKMKITVE